MSKPLHCPLAFYAHPLVRRIGIAFLFSLTSLVLPPRYQPLANSGDIRTSTGSPCTIQHYGFPLPFLSDIKEPCAYAISPADKRGGVTLGYVHVDALLFMSNSILWYGGLLLVGAFVRSREEPTQVASKGR